MESNQQPTTRSVYVDDEIDLRELFWILWAEKWLIIGITALFAVISVVVSLMMTEIYRAEATLAPAETEQGAGGLAAQLGGAAALLGMNVGDSGGGNISNAIATLQSRQFIGRFIEDNNLLVPLFASNWDKNKQRSVVNRRIYDSKEGVWLLKKGAPTEHDAFRRFTEILNVDGPDIESGIVTVSIDWLNPEEAAMWVNQLVAGINQDMRARDVKEAKNAIEYLQSQLEATQLVEMQRVFYQLIESQTRITMLADVREEYVFRVIDPAIAPDRRESPRRILIVILGTLVGGILATMSGLVRGSWKRTSQQ